MEFSKAENTEKKEQTMQPIKVENISDIKKYTKPEVEKFHKDIIKDYPKTNEKNLQTTLETLDKDL